MKIQSSFRYKFGAFQFLIANLTIISDIKIYKSYNKKIFVGIYLLLSVANAM